MEIVRTTNLIAAGLISLFISGCTPKHTHPEHHKGVMVHDAWVRAVPPNMKMTAAYMTLHNHSDMQDALLSAETTIAGVVETHTVQENEGVMSMKPIDSIPLGPHSIQELKPGGYHLMLMKLSKTLKLGDEIEFILHFKHSGMIKVIAPVKEGKTMNHKMSHDHG